MLNGISGTVSVTKCADGRYRIGLNDVRLLQSGSDSYYSSGANDATPAPEPTPTPEPKTQTSVTVNGEIIVEDIPAE